MLKTRSSLPLLGAPVRPGYLIREKPCRKSPGQFTSYFRVFARTFRDCPGLFPSSSLLNCSFLVWHDYVMWTAVNRDALESKAS